MIALDVALDARNLRRLRLLAGASRLTAAKALTFTAERSIPAWQAANRRTFNMRREWINKGVRMRPATPGKLNARVGSIDRYMGRHVVGIGEEKRGDLFIPVYRSIGQALTHTQNRRKMRGYERTKRKPFVIRLNGGGALVVRREGKKRTPLVTLGKLQTGAEIEERLDARAVVEGVTNREFPPIYERLLLKWAETGKA